MPLSRAVEYSAVVYCGVVARSLLAALAGPSVWKPLVTRSCPLAAAQIGQTADVARVKRLAVLRVMQSGSHREKVGAFSQKAAKEPKKTR